MLPTLVDFFRSHPLINPNIFLGDAAFDSVSIYKQLLSGDTFGKDKHFSAAYIPLNARSPLKSTCPVNENGIPCCPNNSSLELKRESKKSDYRYGVETIKFVCPKTTYDKLDTGKYRRVCHCEHPCTSSCCGRMVYIYPEKDLRTYLGTLRGNKEWDATYKIRMTVERSINHFKDSFVLPEEKLKTKKLFILI